MAETKAKSRIKNLKIAKRAIYASALILLTALLIIQVSQCLQLYLEEPTYFSSRIVQQKDAQFPAMTFCPEEKRYKPDQLEAHGISNYNAKGVTSWSSNSSSVSEKELFRLLTHSVQDIFREIYIRFFDADRDGKFNTKLDLQSKDSLRHNFQEQRHRSFGRCYTLLPERNIRDLGVYYIRLKLRIPVKIYFHAPDQFLDLSGRMGYKVFLGEEIQAQVSYEDINLLSRKDSSGKLSCLDAKYDSCMYSALEEHMMSAHGCVVPFILSDKDVCTEPDDVNGTFWIAWNRVTNQFNDCSLPCEAVLVTLSGKNSKRLSSADRGAAYFYFPPRVVENKENYFYSLLSTLAEIGGYVGLLLGISFFHLASSASGLIESRIREMEEKEGDDEVKFHSKVANFRR